MLALLVVFNMQESSIAGRRTTVPIFVRSPNIIRAMAQDVAPNVELAGDTLVSFEESSEPR